MITDLPDLRKMNLKPAGGSAGKTGDTKEPKRFRKLVTSVISRSTQGGESKQDDRLKICLRLRISFLCSPLLPQ